MEPRAVFDLFLMQLSFKISVHSPFSWMNVELFLFQMDRKNFKRKFEEVLKNDTNELSSTDEMHRNNILGNAGNTMDDNSSTDSYICTKKKTKKMKMKKRVSYQKCDHSSDSENDRKFKIVSEKKKEEPSGYSCSQDCDDQETLYQNLEGHPKYNEWLLEMFENANNNEVESK